MRTLLLGGSVAFLITFFVLPAIIKIAAAKQLFDLPDSRKLHQRPIASLGGVGMFVGFFLTDLLLVSQQALPQLQYYLATALVIFFLGLKDDILIITPLKKLVGQMIAAAILIHLAGLRITTLHGVMGIQELSPWWQIVISYAVIILLINAYNLIDGIDGLAGALGLLNMAVFGLLFSRTGDEAHAMLAFAMGGSLLAFLLFNHQPAKIFMGDSGSMIIGLFNALFTLRLLQLSAGGDLLPVPAVVPLVVALLSVPLTDTLRVFSIRLWQGRSPFAPDRNHVHHLLLQRGFNHRRATLACVLANVLLLALVWWGRHLGATGMLCLLAGTVLVLLAVLAFRPRTNSLQRSIATFQKQRGRAANIPLPKGAASAA